MIKQNGFLVISGCPRSGTSVCMDIQRAAHGDDVILGHKFPQEIRKAAREEALERQEDEKDHEYLVRKYLIEKQLLSEKLQRESEPHQKYHDMNPEGFWECAFSVQGIIYHPVFSGLLNGVKNGEFKIVKVVSQGLLPSDPAYIGKIIYMIRHPRAVAKSQERLTRGFSVRDEETGEIRNPFEDFLFHSPEMYIGVTVQAARFLINHPDIPIKFFDFEELISDPKASIDAMADFVGCGNYDKAYDVVQPKLNRSQPEDIDCDLWPDAEFVYGQFKQAASEINNGDRENADKYLHGIIEYFKDPKRAYNRTVNTWPCYRSKRQVKEAMCLACYYDPNTREGYKQHSESLDTKVEQSWRLEPCLFECGMDVRRDNYLTIDESIESNFWVPKV